MCAIVCDEIDGSGFAHPLSVVENDGAVIESLPVIADLDLSVAQVARSLKTNLFKTESVVVADMPIFFGEEEFVVGLVGREEANAGEVDAETVNGFHAQSGMSDGIVFVLDPIGKLSVEDLHRREVESSGEEGGAGGPMKSFNLSLRRSISYRGVAQQTSDASADLGAFCW